VTAREHRADIRRDMDLHALTDAAVDARDAGDQVAYADAIDRIVRFHTCTPLIDVLDRIERAEDLVRAEREREDVWCAAALAAAKAHGDRRLALEKLEAVRAAIAESYLPAAEKAK
jgi:hypothetical protein